MSFFYVTIFASFVTVVLSQNATVCDEARLYTFIPDVRDCSAWFFCGLQGPVSGNCLNDYQFNPETRICDWPQNVGCFECPSNVGLRNIRMNGSCRSFIRCIGGNPAQNVCEDGLQFNDNTGQCDLPEIVQCTTGFRCPDELPIDGSIVAMRDNYNCSVYHLCIGSPQAVRQECNQDLHFDPVTSLCTFPNLTSCPINEHPGGPGNGPGGPTSSTTLSTTPITTTQPTPIFDCPFDGIHPHPTNCSEYFICAANIPHLMRCAQGLHFNALTLQCDFPENARCEENGNFI